MKAGDKFTVSPRNNYDVLTGDLLESGTKTLTENVKVAVKQLFDKFAVESDGLQYLGTDQIKTLIEVVGTNSENKPSAILAYNTNEDASKMLFGDFLSFYTTMA